MALPPWQSTSPWVCPPSAPTDAFLQIVNNLKAGRTSAQALGVKLIVIPRAGHLSMLSEPALVARAIGSFAARVERAPKVSAVKKRKR